MSSLYKQIENAFNLMKWSERKVAYGCAVMGLPDAAEIARLDPDADDGRKELDKLVVAAHEAAETHIAAQRGTHGHLLTEDFDTDRDPVARLEAGQALGLPEWLQRAVVRCWEMICKSLGLEVLAVEERCVYDQWRVAGTLDRIARVTVALRFPNGVVIPAGTIVVLDIKTGRLRLANDGHPDYWHGYACQVAAYAFSTRYVIVEQGVTEHRMAWDWDISHEWGLIAHLDIREALLTGILVGRVFAVDLVAGAEAGRIVLEAKDYERRRDLFSLLGTEVAVSVHEVENEARVLAKMEDELGAELVPQPSDAEVLTWVRARVERIAAFSDPTYNALIRYWPDDVPVLREVGIEHVDALVHLLDRIETHYSIPFGETDPRVIANRPPPRHGGKT
jgi:hypothetical protein